MACFIPWYCVVNKNRLIVSTIGAMESGWGGGVPNIGEFDRESDCMYMNTDGLWEDYLCGVFHAMVLCCEQEQTNCKY